MPAALSGHELNHALSWFTGENTALSFHHEISTETVTIPEPADLRFKAVKLHLRGIASTALKTGASTLLVSVNGDPVTTVPLDGNRPDINDAVTLPGSLFAQGYNRITFRAVLTAGRICEKLSDPSLWARISSQSQVTITTSSRVVKPRFSRLGSIFDKHALRHAETVTILYNKKAAQDPSTIVGAAEGIGLRYDYVPVRIKARALSSAALAAATAQHGDVIVLDPHAAHDATKEDEAADLKLASTQGGGTLLRITGSDQAVASAGRLVGAAGIAWPAADSAHIETGGPRRPIARGEPVDDLYLRALGSPTSTRDGPSVNFSPVTFWNDEWGGRAVLSVHLAYGAGAAPGAAIDVYVNGTFVGGMPLGNADGGVYRAYKIPVPHTALLPGKNELQFRGEVNRRTGGAGTCVSRSRMPGVPVTLYGDSHINLVGGSNLKPDNLAALTTADIAPHHLLIAGTSPGTLSAAATIAAKIAQVDKAADLRAAPYTSGELPHNAIVIGAFGKLPADILERAGILPNGKTLAVRGKLEPITAKRGPSAFAALPRWLAGPLRLEAPNIIGKDRRVLVSGYGDATVAAMLPSGPTGTVLVAARNGAALAAGTATLIGWSHWSQLAGHAAVVEPGAKRLAIVQSSIHPEDLRGQAGYFASQHLGAAIGVLIIVLVVAAALIFITLRIRARRRARKSGEREGGS